MLNSGTRLALSITIVFVAGCNTAEKTPADSTTAAAAPAAAATDPAADQTAIRDLNTEWFRLYNTHDAAALAALYADDAVLMMPGLPVIRGREAIQAAYKKDMDFMSKAGNLNNLGNNSEVSVSGDLGYESNSFNITDKAGKQIDSGKYVTVFARKDGKWMIVRDIWNSDKGPVTP